MFRISDYRQTGMPTLGVTKTAEAARELADRLGIGAHACIEPVTEERDWDTAHRDALLDEMGAERIDQLLLGFAEAA